VVPVTWKPPPGRVPTVAGPLVPSPQSTVAVKSVAFASGLPSVNVATTTVAG
jgi:hypothetical protein